MTDADAIIVGSGPAGLMLAGELQLAGVRPLVLERQRPRLDQLLVPAGLRTRPQLCWGVWSLVRRDSRADTAFADPDHLMCALRHGLRQVRYRNNLIDGCLAETGLTVTTTRQRGLQLYEDRALVTVRGRRIAGGWFPAAACGR